MPTAKTRVGIYRSVLRFEFGDRVTARLVNVRFLPEGSDVEIPVAHQFPDFIASTPVAAERKAFAHFQIWANSQSPDLKRRQRLPWSPPPR